MRSWLQVWDTAIGDGRPALPALPSIPRVRVSVRIRVRGKGKA